MDDNLLKLPANIGKLIVEKSAVIACPLMGTDRFVDFCKKRGLKINRERLIRLERLGLFSPVFRVTTPTEEEGKPFRIPIHNGNNWFDKGFAWDTTNISNCHSIPDHKDRTQEGYYSVFQIDLLSHILTAMTLQVELDSFLENDDERVVDWKKNANKWLQYAKSSMESIQKGEHKRCLSMLCQFVSNIYFPLTQSDQRTINVSGGSYSDHWVNVNGNDWNWGDEFKSWDPKIVEQIFELTPEKLEHAYNGIAGTQAYCDPLEKWYQLTQFIEVRERAKLKGQALRAETLRAGAHLLRFLYQDLYGRKLPIPNEVVGKIITHIPELDIREDPRRYLEYVVNRYGLNPQPKLTLIVEGESEKAAVLLIFEKYYGNHPGKYGIEIIVLGSVDVATGSKEDRFRAILRLVDYLHHHQTITFLILDNENYAEKLKHQARKSKSTYSNKRYITRQDYIRIWGISFEFDNFSCGEIADAMNDVSKGHAKFSIAEIIACKNDRNPGSCIQRLYKNKAQYGLQKIKLNEILVNKMMSPMSKRKIENRPIIKTLERVVKLAIKNPLPATHEIWKENQASKYLGKKYK